MIPASDITAWGVTRPWPSRAAVEQDLLLARLIVELYTHPYLRDELVFRGGTCLHQVHLSTPLRCGEDLDFVRRTHLGIGLVFDALRDVARVVGLDVRGTEVGEHPKMRLRAAPEDGGPPLRIKIEINTHETSPAHALVRMPFGVDTAWFCGDAEVLTFSSAELAATKLRALFQRKKGRDLFDLWLVLTRLQTPPAAILSGFEPYRPQGYTSSRAIDNLRGKQHDPAFRRDLDLLVASQPVTYSIEEAADLVIDSLLSRV